MPWNDNANPGPWGSPPSGEDGDRKDPPPRKPAGGGRGPNRPGAPDLGAGLDRLRAQLRGLFSGPGGVRPGAMVGILAAIFALWALSGVYLVQPSEVAVVTTFGAYSRNEGPGPRYHLPWPIEKVEKVPVTALNRFDIGGNSAAVTPAADGSDTTASAATSPSLMLTSDKDIVDLNFSVTWRISDPGRYVFATRDPEDAVKAVAESAMREVVGRTALDDVLNKSRGKVQFETADQMQRILDAWGMGVRIVEVQIRSAGPPPEVVAAFRDVQSAQQDRDSAENVADAYRNKVVNEAKGDAARIVQASQAYREQAERTATGEASRFNAIYNEYRKSPQATRDRLYLETMERVLRNSNKVVISGKGITAPVILPPDVFRPRGSGEMSVQAPPPATSQGGAARVQPQSGTQQ